MPMFEIALHSIVPCDPNVGTDKSLMESVTWSPKMLPVSSTKMHNSTNKSPNHEREVTEFCGNRPSKNVCVRDPEFLGFFPTSERVRALHSGM